MSNLSPITEVRVPDIGELSNILVIEVLAKRGMQVEADQPIVTLETEKATLDVPAPLAGRVLTIEVAEGSRVNTGTLLLTLATDESAAPVGETVAPSTAVTAVAPIALTSDDSPDRKPAKAAAPVRSPVIEDDHAGSKRSLAYAGPAVRRMVRELGVDLGELKGSGRSGRILKQDVQRWVRDRLAGTSTHQRAPDFAVFGPVDRQPLSRIRRVSGQALARNWATIPHVTNFDDADITDLESFRTALNAEGRGEARLSILSVLIKASACTLRSMPAFNASLDGQDLVMKKYVNIGFAVDTPSGLLVPVLRDADHLTLLQIAAAVTDKAVAAREGRLKLDDMQGGCFTVSSLGGIGGRTFTPIINAPELAILGAGKASIRARWDGSQFVPRLMLPLSLSWDHRAIDGADAARFLAHLVSLLQDPRRMLL